jgi:hypothetical protein
MANDDKRRGRPDPQPWVPPKDGVLGGIDPQVKDLVFQNQQRAQALIVQIGQIDLQKDSLIGQVRQLNAEAQEAIDKEAQRLGIPPGVPWQLGGDGVARLVPQQAPGMPPGPGPGLRPVPQQPPAPPQEEPPSEGKEEAPPEEEPPKSEEASEEKPPEKDDSKEEESPDGG